MSYSPEQIEKLTDKQISDYLDSLYESSRIMNERLADNFIQIRLCMTIVRERMIARGK